MLAGGPRASDAADARALLASRLATRTDASDTFFASQSARLAVVCHLMAERFARGGRLLALGASPADRSDAHHVAVEFVHPVIVGKRALPALAIAGQPGEVAWRLELLARPDDIVIAFGESGRAPALAPARERGCLTVGFGAGGAEHEFDPGVADPFIRQELIETLYHVLWELVHVFFEHRGLLEGRAPRRTHDAGASAFLYPFLSEAERSLDAVLDDVRASVEMKARETCELRERTLHGSPDALAAAAGLLARCRRTGAVVLALGNGGSATDSEDLVADLVAPPPGSAATGTQAAIDLAADPSVITAVANDIGTEAIFARQVIAYGARGDVLVALSTSGNSESVLAALTEARRRGLATVAFVGYDGGRVAAAGLADHVVVAPSEHIPRIQEAHATAYHLLVELAGLEPAGRRA